MKIGCHALQWGIAIDKDRRHTWDGKVWNVSLENVLSDMAKLHYEGFDCSDNDAIQYFKVPEEFHRMLSQNMLSFVSTWVTLIPRTSTFTQDDKINPDIPMSDPKQFAPLAIPEINIERIRKDFAEKVEYAKNFALLGGQLITLGGPFMLQDNIRNSYYEMIGEYVNDLAVEFKKLGLGCVYHPHLSTLVQNSEEIDRLYDYADKSLIKLLLDTAHLVAVGENPEKIVRKYSTRIGHTHFKDLGQGKFLELGEGNIDFDVIIKALVETGYSGWLIAELDVPWKTAFGSASTNKIYLDKLVAKFAA